MEPVVADHHLYGPALPFAAEAGTDPQVQPFRLNAPPVSDLATEIGIETAMDRRLQRGARTVQLAARQRFLTVAHLWGAWSIRERKFELHPEVGYDGFAEFQSFLTEAEILRDWGQTWRPRRAKSAPPLPADVWRVPDEWTPPERLAGWPQTGRVPLGLTLPDELLAELRPAGRPSRGA